MDFRHTPLPDNDPIQRALGRLEGKVDLILDRLDAADATDTKRDDRISALELGAVRVNAIACVIAFTISAIVPILLSIFKGT
jgi:hypothetical protein